VVYSKKPKNFVTSLANDINDETPWQKIEWWKATFLVDFYHFTVLFFPVLLGMSSQVKSSLRC